MSTEWDSAPETAIHGFNVVAEGVPGPCSIPTYR